jgi:hypothetical protein
MVIGKNFLHRFTSDSIRSLSCEVNRFHLRFKLLYMVSICISLYNRTECIQWQMKCGTFIAILVVDTIWIRWFDQSIFHEMAFILKITKSI